MTSITYNSHALFCAAQSIMDEVDGATGTGKFILADVFNSSVSPDSFCQSGISKEQISKIIADFNPDANNKNFGEVKEIIIYGDSLSDEHGLMYEKTHGILPSDPQFYDGTFTNGYTWPKFLARSLKLACYNVAEGGAVSASYSGIPITGNPAFSFVSNLEAQVKKITPCVGSLVFMFLGANDYMTFGKKDVSHVVSGQKKQIEKMIDNNVRNFVVMGIPDLSTTPYAYERDEQYRAMMHAISDKHNNALKKMVKGLQHENPPVKIIYIDTNQIMRKIMEVAKCVNYDIKNAFFNGGYVSLRDKGKKCTIDHEKFFNDKSHPSQEVHSVFARGIEKVVRDEFGNAALRTHRPCINKTEPKFLLNETSFDINFMKSVF